MATHDEQKAQVQEYFSRTAANYVASTAHRVGVDLQRLIEVGEWEPQQVALDIATGGGHTALAVAPFVAQITVSDLTPTMLEHAQAFLQAQGITNATFELADAEALPFPAASFDRVTCRIAPHHFPHVNKAVQEIARVLKPGGLFLLIDNIVPQDPEADRFINTVEKRRDASHGRAYTQEEWQRFFTDTGLQIEYQEVFSRTHSFDDWTTRSQMSSVEKAELERFILESDEHLQQKLGVQRREDGHIESFVLNSLLLKGRNSS